jgi:hypothetical protein
MHSILVVAAEQAVAAALVNVKTATSSDKYIEPVSMNIPQSFEKAFPPGIPMNLVEYDER